MIKLQMFWAWLKGKKTFTMAIAIGVTSALYAGGVLSGETTLMLYGLFGGGGLASLRDGLNK